MTKSTVKIVAVIAVVAIALILFTYKPWLGAAKPATPLADLHNIEELQALFNQDEGVPRLILLLSPT